MLSGPSMITTLRQFVLVLSALAFIGGASSKIASSAEYAAPAMHAGAPCGMSAWHVSKSHEAPAPPCKGMTADCMKQMGCVADAALPAPTTTADIAARFSLVGYWSAGRHFAGFVRPPEALPPRTT